MIIALEGITIVACFYLGFLALRGLWLWIAAKVRQPTENKELFDLLMQITSEPGQWETKGYGVQHSSGFWIDSYENAVWFGVKTVDSLTRNQTGKIINNFKENQKKHQTEKLTSVLMDHVTTIRYRDNE